MPEIRKQEDSLIPAKTVSATGANLSRWLRLIMASVAAGIVLSIYSLLIKPLHTSNGGDFLSLYLSGLRLRHDVPIYWLSQANRTPGEARCLKIEDLPLVNITRETGPELARLEPCWHPNLNTPFMTVVLAPMTILDFPMARLVWLSVSALAGMLSLFLLGREGLLPKLRSLAFLAVMAAFWSYFPSFSSVLLGQVTFMMLPPLVLGWIMLRQGRCLAAGAWLGLSFSLKPFVGLFLLGLVAQGNWRACQGWLLVCVFCFLLGGAVAGFDAYPMYLDTLSHITWQSASWNASLAGFFSRLLGGSENSPWRDLPWLARGLTLTSSAILLAFYLKAAWGSRGETRSEKADLLAAASIPAMLLISPLGWLYYFPLLLLTVTVLGQRLRPRDGWQWWAWLGGMGLSCVPSWLIKSEDMNNPLDWFGAPAVYMVSLMILFALAILRNYRGKD